MLALLRVINYGILWEGHTCPRCLWFYLNLLLTSPTSDLQICSKEEPPKYRQNLANEALSSLTQDPSHFQAPVGVSRLQALAETSFTDGSVLVSGEAKITQGHCSQRGVATE